jgi:alpha-galactosidase
MAARLLESRALQTGHGYRQHPDWVLHFHNQPRTEARHQLILDRGAPGFLLKC